MDGKTKHSVGFCAVHHVLLHVIFFAFFFLHNKFLLNRYKYDVQSQFQLLHESKHTLRNSVFVRTTRPG